MSHKPVSSQLLRRDVHWVASGQPIPTFPALGWLPRQQQPNCSSLFSKCLLRSGFSILLTYPTGSVGFSELLFLFNEFAHLSIFDIRVKAALCIYEGQYFPPNPLCECPPKVIPHPPVGLKDVWGAAACCWICLVEFPRDWTCVECPPSAELTVNIYFLSSSCFSVII